MKLVASTLKVADATFSEELSAHTIADLPLPFPLRNIYGLFFGMCTFSLPPKNKQAL
jgi:hypothetical protein